MTPGFRMVKSSPLARTASSARHFVSWYGLRGVGPAADDAQVDEATDALHDGTAASSRSRRLDVHGLEGLRPARRA